MANFLKHTSCEKCGSSDAKGIYDDGSSWCFSCHSGSGPSIGERVARSKAGDDSAPRNRALPDDICSHFSAPAVEWLTSTGLDLGTLMKHGVKWSPSKQQIIFTWPTLNLWQARNMYPDAKVRYITSGNYEKDFPFYHCGQPQGLVLVEDCLSAIKIATSPYNYDAMPLLGSSLSSNKMQALKRWYSHVLVWLDHDKGKDALKISTKLKMLGIRTRVIFTDVDPKYVSHDEMKRFL